MDVLHFLKSHHDQVRAGFALLEAAEGVKARRTLLEALARDVQVHVALEKDYLYPELADLFPGSDVLTDTGLASGVVIGKRLKTLVKLAAKTAAEQESFGKRLGELKEAVYKHFEQEEQQLMPKMRAHIRTEDREDLGQLFMDVKAEVLDSLSAPEPAAPAPRGRKRA